MWTRHGGCGDVWSDSKLEVDCVAHGGEHEPTGQAYLKNAEPYRLRLSRVARRAEKVKSMHFTF